jgi:hypothetical protein
MNKAEFIVWIAITGVACFVGGLGLLAMWRDRL